MLRNNSWNRNLVQLTHLPTGIVVKVDCYRSQHQNRDAAYKRLRSRLLAEGLGIASSENVVATYRLPDDDQYPNNLDDHKRVLVGD